MERLAPTMFTSKTGERNRKNKIFVDYLRNGFGATAVAAFSPRWRPGVGVSTPVAWDEIDDDIRGTHFDLHNVPERVAEAAQGSVEGLLVERRQSLTKPMLEQMSRKWGQTRFLANGAWHRYFSMRYSTPARVSSVPRCTRTPTSFDSL